MLCVGLTADSQSGQTSALWNCLSARLGERRRDDCVLLRSCLRSLRCVQSTLCVACATEDEISHGQSRGHARRRPSGEFCVHMDPCLQSPVDINYSKMDEHNQLAGLKCNASASLRALL